MVTVNYQSFAGFFPQLWTVSITFVRKASAHLAQPSAPTGADCGWLACAVAVPACCCCCCCCRRL